MKILLLLVAFAVWWPDRGAHADVPLSEFFSFNSLPNEYFDQKHVELSRPFKVLGEWYTKLSMKYSGWIRFGSASTCCWGGSHMRPKYCEKKFLQGMDVRSSTSEVDKTKARTEILRAFPELKMAVVPAFEIQDVHVLTWLNTSIDSADGCGRHNSFQVALVQTTQEASFFVVYFNQLQKVDGSDSTVVAIRNSHQPEFGLNLQPSFLSESNVGVAGKWVFRADRYLQFPSNLVAIKQDALECKEDFLEDGRLKTEVNGSPFERNIRLRGPCAGSGAIATCHFKMEDGQEWHGKATIRKPNGRALFNCATVIYPTFGMKEVTLKIQEGTALRTYKGHFEVRENVSSFLHVELIKNSDGEIDAVEFGWDREQFNSAWTQSQGYNKQPEHVIIEAFEPPEGVDAKWLRSFGTLIGGDAAIREGELRVSMPSLAIALFGMTENSTLHTYADSHRRIIFSVQFCENGDDDEPSCKGPRLYSRIGPSALVASAINDYLLGRNTTESCRKVLQLLSPLNATNISCPPFWELAPEDLRFQPADITHWQRNASDRCVSSVYPNEKGVQQQCCYRGGVLQIDEFGGRPFASSWNLERSQQLDEFWKREVYPLAVCCGSEGGLCAEFNKKRPVDDGSNYEVPQQAVIYGNAHVVTFDGLNYTTAEINEMWLLKRTTDQPLSIQGRFESVGEASTLTAIVMQEEGMPKIQVEERRVFVDGQELHALDWTSTTRNISIRVTADRKEVNVVFASGCAVRLHLKYTTSLLIYCDSTHKGALEGLFGNFNGSASDDWIQSRQEYDYEDEIYRNVEDAYTTTMKKWKVQQSESLYDYFTLNYARFNREDPPWPVPSTTVSTDSLRTCGPVESCAYDYKTAESEAFAMETYRFFRKYEALRNAANLPLVCPPLQQPFNGQCKAKNRFVGTTAHCDCLPEWMSTDLELPQPTAQTLECEGVTNETQVEAQWTGNFHSVICKDSPRYKFLLAVRHFNPRDVPSNVTRVTVSEDGTLVYS